MWDAIQRNRRRSNVLIGLMGLILVSLGMIFGMVFQPEYGAYLGIAVAIGLWVTLCVVAHYHGDDLLLLSAAAQKVERADCPRLWNVVEEMTIAAGIGTPPKVFVIDDEAPNAFAVGRNPDHAAVAVTSGLLKVLNRDELQGVVAHEIGHIKNQDVRFMTNAAVLLGTIVLLSDAFLRYMFFGVARRRVPTKGPPQAQIVMMVVAVVAAILAPICARLLYLACSRKREYLADACGAQFSRYPEGLASALEKISGRAARMNSVSRSVAPLLIVNPLQPAVGSARSLLSTHPPTYKRVRILRNMGGAGFADYEAAYRGVNGGDERCMGLSTLAAAKSVAVREPTQEKETKKDAIERAREVIDVVDRLADYLLITCFCGVRIKLPPEYKRSTIDCPRCGHAHGMPTAEAQTAGTSGSEVAGETGGDPAPSVAGVTPSHLLQSAAMVGVGAGTGLAAAATAAVVASTALQYQRKGAGWESFKCECGRTVQISPSLKAPFVNCRKCRRRVEILECAAQPAETASP